MRGLACSSNGRQETDIQILEFPLEQKNTRSSIQASADNDRSHLKVVKLICTERKY
jgi:hypothetical protein